MRQKFETPKTTLEQVVKDIRRATRKHHSAEKKTVSSSLMPREILQVGPLQWWVDHLCNASSAAAECNKIDSLAKNMSDAIWMVRIFVKSSRLGSGIPANVNQAAAIASPRPASHLPSSRRRAPPGAR